MLNEADAKFYRELLAITTDEAVFSRLKLYFDLLYSQALKTLKHNGSPEVIYRAQGEIAVLERLINMQTEIRSVLSNDR